MSVKENFQWAAKACDASTLPDAFCKTLPPKKDCGCKSKKKPKELIISVPLVSKEAIEKLNIVLDWTFHRNELLEKMKRVEEMHQQLIQEVNEQYEIEADRFAEVLRSDKRLAKALGFKTSDIKPKPKAVKKTIQKESYYSRLAKGLRVLKEDITSSGASGALGQVWNPNMIVLPTDLPANLRRFVQVKEIPKGAKQVNFSTITTPAFASMIEDTAPSDVSQTIAEVSAVPAENGVKQRISYSVMESATPFVAEAIEKAFQAAALTDEDGTILSALDAASSTDAGTIFSGGATSESNVSVSFAPNFLVYSIGLIGSKGYDIHPGDLVCVMHPVQFQSLLTWGYQSYMAYGSTVPMQKGLLKQMFGIDIVLSTKIPTGIGSGGAVTYHAQVFLKASAVGLGVSRELLIERWRKIDERDLYVLATHRVAAGIIQPGACVRIITT